MVQHCINDHEAIIFRRRDPDGPSSHEFPAMVAQLRLKLAAGEDRSGPAIVGSVVTPTTGIRERLAVVEA
jgi:hypothetical protein